MMRYCEALSAFPAAKPYVRISPVSWVRLVPHSLPENDYAGQEEHDALDRPDQRASFRNIHDSMQGLYQPLPSHDQSFYRRRQFISGNRCERGIGGQKEQEDIPNLFEYKNQTTLRSL